jgi:hypothetical protein
MCGPKKEKSKKEKKEEQRPGNSPWLSRTLGQDHMCSFLIKGRARAGAFDLISRLLPPLLPLVCLQFAYFFPHPTNRQSSARGNSPPPPCYRVVRVDHIYLFSHLAGSRRRRRHQAVCVHRTEAPLVAMLGLRLDREKRLYGYADHVL